MAIYFPSRDALLLLPAKCGSSWLRGISTTVKEPAIFLGPLELRSHGGLDFYGRHFAQIAAFIRHPFEWHVSYWNYRTYVRGYWEPDRAPVDRDCGARPFDEYIECVYAHYPTRVSDYFARFIGTNENRIDFIGKLESIRYDFELLATAWELGLTVKPSTLPAVNAQEKKETNPNLRELVFESEKSLYLEFGYLP